MDIEMIDAILDNDKTYQDFEKHIYISKLQIAFQEFTSLGDTHLFSVKGSCNSCNKIRTGYTFIGNNSKNFMSIIFDTSNCKVNDLDECRNFSPVYNEWELKDRIYIDDDVSLPF